MATGWFNTDLNACWFRLARPVWLDIVLLRDKSVYNIYQSGLTMGITLLKQKLTEKVYACLRLWENRTFQCFCTYAISLGSNDLQPLFYVQQRKHLDILENILTSYTLYLLTIFISMEAADRRIDDSGIADSIICWSKHSSTKAFVDFDKRLSKLAKTKHLSTSILIDHNLRRQKLVDWKICRVLYINGVMDCWVVLVLCKFWNPISQKSFTALRSIYGSR